MIHQLALVALIVCVSLLTQTISVNATTKIESASRWNGTKFINQQRWYHFRIQYAKRTKIKFPLDGSDFEFIYYHSPRHMHLYGRKYYYTRPRFCASTLGKNRTLPCRHANTNGSITILNCIGGYPNEKFQGSRRHSANIDYKRFKKTPRYVTLPANTTIRKCCPGWESYVWNRFKACRQAICKPGCLYGDCKFPNKCLYQAADSDSLKRAVHSKTCNRNIVMINSTEITISGKQSNPHIPIELCKWSLNIRSATTFKGPSTRISVNSVEFGGNTTCAESMITLRASRENDRGSKPVFFFCSQVRPTHGEKIKIEDGLYTLEFLRSKWKPGDGLTLKFEMD